MCFPGDGNYGANVCFPGDGSLAFKIGLPPGVPIHMPLQLLYYEHASPYAALC